MRYNTSTKLILCCILVALLSTSTLNAQQVITSLEQVKTIINKNGPMTKISSDLVTLQAEYSGFAKANSNGRFSGFKPLNKLMPVHEGYVVVDAVADEDATQLLSDLKELGLQNAASFGRVVSGLMPINQINNMALLKSMRFARPAYNESNLGIATTQGDKALSSDLSRKKFNVDGTGNKIGIISNNFDYLEGAAAGILSGDLPGPGNPNGYTTPVKVLQDSPINYGGFTDEGRAMAEIIHDVAPGATMAFHTAQFGQANFAQGIIDLQEAGCNLIVDDVIYFAEPFFQDGIIAQAVDYVTSKGVSYFSAAGNRKRNSYESAFTPSNKSYISGKAHSFAPGDEFQDITIPFFSSITVVLQWDDSFYSHTGKGAKSDLNFFLVNDAITNVVALSANRNIGGDPVEIIQFTNLGVETKFKLLIEKFDGPNPKKIKYIVLSGVESIDEYDTKSSTIFGHPNAAGAIAVGAAFWGFTPKYGVTSPVIQSSSSAGGTPILFDVEGNPVNIIRNKPQFTAPDGGNTTFFGQIIKFPSNSDNPLDSDAFPNFFGTSASAPHATAVAALMMEASNYSLTTSQIVKNLQNTAIDMDDPLTPGFDTGYDLRTGSGLIQADKAVDAVFAGQRVVSFTLVNVRNGRDIMQIKDGDKINLSLLPTILLNIRANTDPEKVGSVVLKLNDKVVTQNAAPYTIAGEYHTIFGIIFNPLLPPLSPGEYTLSATPYTLAQGTGKAGAKETVRFSVVEEISVVSFTLVNAETGEDIYELENDMLLDLSALPAHLNIRANTDSYRTGSVSLSLNGKRVTENNQPYTFAGHYYDRGRKYRSMNPPLTAGDYTLSAAAYSGKFAGGFKGKDYVIKFKIVEGDILARKAFDTDKTDKFIYPIHVSPNPSSGKFTVQLGNQGTQEANIYIYNAKGTLVGSYRQEGEYEKEVNLSGMPAGLYMMKVEGNNAVQSIRLIKQ